MSSRITNSESQRGIKGETLRQADIKERHSRPQKDNHSSFRGVNPSRWSDVEANNASKSDDYTMWPSLDASPGDDNVKRDEDSSDMRHKIPADPGFDGRRQHHSRPLDDSWSQPQRARVSVQSRDRDGSRSRSRSRGTGRSRSRSRSWDRDEGDGRGRSRSPFHDDRHESNANIDRASGPRLLSRVCRDFAMGKCRRGSNCRFPHQDNLNSQGGRHSDNDVTQRSSSRPEYEGASRYGDNSDSADRMHDTVPDGSRRDSGKDEPDSRERSSRKPDGARRYPHHVAAGDNHNKGNRNASYNHDVKGPPNRSGKLPCKFFPIGKCHREDCRFSHDAPTSEGVDGRSRDDRLGHIADEKKNSSDIAKSSRQHGTSGRNLNSYDSTAYDKHMDDKNMSLSWSGPEWDEVGVPNLSDMANSSGRGNSFARNLNSYDPVATGKRTYENKAQNDMEWDETSAPGLTDTKKPIEGGQRSFGNIKTHGSGAIGKHNGARGGHGWENNSRPMGGSVWNDKAPVRNDYNSPGANTDAYIGANEYMSTKKDGNEEAQLVIDQSRSQALGGISIPSHERNRKLDASGHEPASTVMQAQVSESSSRYGRDNPATFNDSNVLDVVTEDSTYPVLTPKQVFDQSGHSMSYQSHSNFGGNEKRCSTISSNPFNQNEAGEAQELPELGFRQVRHETSETVVSSEQVAQITDLPAILNQISQNGQLPQIIAALNPNNGMGLVHSIPTSASVAPTFPPVNSLSVPLSMDMKSKEQYDPGRDSMEIQNPGGNNEPSGVLSTSMGKEHEVPPEKLSLFSTSVPNSTKLHPGEEHQGSPKSKQQGPRIGEEVKNVAEKYKQEQEKNLAGVSDAQCIVEEGSISNDEKAMRLFKIALVDFVKEILKPTWKEGGMSREVHKTIVKKVVDKVTSTVQGIQIPRTPEKIEQYLAFSKSKITKLVAAYVERFSKAAADA